jgi:signal transduction histidine kinase
VDTVKIETNELLAALKITLPIMQELFPLDVMFGITDQEKFIYYLPGKEIDIELPLGAPIPQRAGFRKVLDTGEPVSVNIDKEVYGVPFKSNAIPIKDEDGKNVGVITMGISLLNQELISHAAQALDGFCSLDNEWHFSYVNRVAMEYASRYVSLNLEQQVIGKYIWDIFPKTPIFFKNITKVKCTRTPVHFELFSQLAQQWLSINLYPLSDGGVAVYFRNIDEQKRIQKEMARLDQLHLVGEMAASISHEIRNPMTTVRGYLQMLKAKERLLDFSGQFDLMIEELDRANQIISEFLSLANNKIVVRKPVNLVEIIKAILPLIESDARLLGQNVKTELQEIPMALLDPREIRQLILNLVRNAFEAMQSGGTLTIKTYKKNDEIVFTVQDEGEGIPDGILSKLGTPFLTTKENGTGLGLATCYSIAKRNEASLDFKTGHSGTIFYLYIKEYEG